MNLPPLDTLPAWAMLLGLVAHFGAGFALGILFYRSLWWSARRFAARESLATIIALMIGRFALMGAILALASFEGALPLLIMALGMFLARFAVMNAVREAAP